MRYKFCLLIISASFFWTNLVSAQTEKQMLISHPSIELDSLSVQQLRRIYLARQQFWPTGQKITVVMHTQLSTAHQTFCQEYLSVFPYQVERVWNQLVYSGQAEAPLYRESDLRVIDVVSKTPGAIGYITAIDSLPSSVRQITLDNTAEEAVQ